MYKVTSKKGEEFQIKIDNDNFSINGIPGVWDIRKVKDNLFHVLFDGKSYEAELIKKDEHKFHLFLFGSLIEVQRKINQKLILSLFLKKD